MLEGRCSEIKEEGPPGPGAIRCSGPPASMPRVPSCSKPQLVVIARHKCPALADEEVEIDAFIGLQHMVDVKLPVT